MTDLRYHIRRLADRLGYRRATHVSSIASSSPIRQLAGDGPGGDRRAAIQQSTQSALLRRLPSPA